MSEDISNIVVDSGALKDLVELMEQFPPEYQALADKLVTASSNLAEMVAFMNPERFEQRRTAFLKRFENA